MSSAVSSPRGIALRARSENVRGQHIELRRLVDGLDGVLPEQAVAPGDQVVEILHDDAVLVGERCRVRATACGWNGLVRYRRRSPEDDLVLSDLRRRASSSGLPQQLEQLIDPLTAERPAEAQELPEARWLWRIVCSSGRRCSGTSAAPRRSAGSCSGARRSSAGRGRTAPSCSSRTARRRSTSISLGDASIDNVAP